jgi:amino acid transporter
MAARQGDNRQHGFSGLGTFAGVFTPSILTILGIILFLRLGHVVGSGGLGLALLILLLANLISVLTSLSLSAIATNLHVKRGGDYYLISRTLGPRFGGAIGIVLFLAQSVSLGFYAIGFAEVLTERLPWSLPGGPTLMAALAVAVLFVFAWLGADWASRFQFVVMAILAAALLSFFIGGAERFSIDQLQQNWWPQQEGGDFWLLFALFFPAVTGFTQGVSMSGDLRDPGRSIPRGTLWAVGLSILIYFLAALVFAAALPGATLRTDYGAMQQVALYAPLITAGVIAATLSSAMASFMGAPRILQSLAQDRLFPLLTPFARGTGADNNPRRGVLLSAGVALVTVSLGDLNLIAPVVSMCFLISYGLINYATFFEIVSASPSFRPRFRLHHPLLSLLGALSCAGAMLAVDLLAGVAAIAVMAAIYLYLQRTLRLSRWADGRRSWHLQRIRAHLLEVAHEPDHPRDWRPNILLFSDSSHRRRPLLQLAASLEGGSGFVTAVQLLEGDGLKMVEKRDAAEELLRTDIQQADVEAFALAVAVPDLDRGLHTLVQSFGLGPLRTNLLLLNWLEHRWGRDDRQAEQRFGRHLRTAYRLGCNLLVLDGEDDEWARLEQTRPGQRRIDVWWWGDATSHLMLLLAHLMTRTPNWQGARIRVLQPCGDEVIDPQAMRAELEEMRIDAEACQVTVTNGQGIVDHSRDAALVFMPLTLRRNQPLDPFGGALNEVLEPLPPVVMTLAAQDIVLDAEPEQGALSERAELLDAVRDTRRLVELTETDYEKSKRDYEKALNNQDESPENIEHLHGELEHSHRRLLKARYRAEEAARDARALGLLDDLPTTDG